LIEEEKYMLSILLPVKNVAGILQRCLDSTRWADEVLLIDGNSSDSTCQIASSYSNVRIIQHPSKDIRVIVSESEPLARNPWIFWLCADEVVTPKLAAEIPSACTNAPGDVAAFLIPSVDNLFGVDWGPGGSWPRLWRKGTAKFRFERIHEMPEFSGKIEKLESPFLHINNPNIRTLLPKHLRYEYIDAQSATDEQCAKVKSSFWYQLLRFNYYAIRIFLPQRKLGYPAAGYAFGTATGQLLRHLLLIEELRIRKGLTQRDTHGWE
jgi:glycosyltransferase involved in cell wall biosynthesis